MIKKEFLFPEVFVLKVPYCDKCETRLIDTGKMIAVNPPLYTYKCPKCNEEYKFNEGELGGEWKWRIT